MIKFYDSNGKHWGEYDETRGLFIPSEELLTSFKTCRFGEVDGGYVRCAYYSKATEQTEPQKCETCRFELYWPEMCEGCCEWDSHYEPNDEPQTERSNDAE